MLKSINSLVKNNIIHYTGSYSQIIVDRLVLPDGDLLLTILKYFYYVLIRDPDCLLAAHCFEDALISCKMTSSLLILFLLMEWEKYPKFWYLLTLIIMAIVVENGIGNPSSNLRQGCLHFTLL